VLSLVERQVGDRLYAHGMAHDKEAMYPLHLKLDKAVAQGDDIGLVRV
jgi:hypothetical protein